MRKVRFTARVVWLVGSAAFLLLSLTNPHFTALAGEQGSGYPTNHGGNNPIGAPGAPGVGLASNEQAANYGAPVSRPLPAGYPPHMMAGQNLAGNNGHAMAQGSRRRGRSTGKKILLLVGVLAALLGLANMMTIQQHNSFMNIINRLEHAAELLEPSKELAQRVRTPVADRTVKELESKVAGLAELRLQMEDKVKQASASVAVRFQLLLSSDVRDRSLAAIDDMIKSVKEFEAYGQYQVQRLGSTITPEEDAAKLSGKAEELRALVDPAVASAVTATLASLEEQRQALASDAQAAISAAGDRPKMENEDDGPLVACVAEDMDYMKNLSGLQKAAIVTRQEVLNSVSSLLTRKARCDLQVAKQDHQFLSDAMRVFLLEGEELQSNEFLKTLAAGIKEVDELIKEVTEGLKEAERKRTAVFRMYLDGVRGDLSNDPSAGASGQPNSMMSEVLGVLQESQKISVLLEKLPELMMVPENMPIPPSTKLEEAKKMMADIVQAALANAASKAEEAASDYKALLSDTKESVVLPVLRSQLLAEGRQAVQEAKKGEAECREAAAEYEKVQNPEQAFAKLMDLLSSLTKVTVARNNVGLVESGLQMLNFMEADVDQNLQVANALDFSGLLDTQERGQFVKAERDNLQARIQELRHTDSIQEAALAVAAIRTSSRVLSGLAHNHHLDGLTYQHKKNRPHLWKEAKN